MHDDQKTILIDEETDPVEIAQALARHRSFERNWAWLEAHAKEVYSHRGRFICIAAEELFVADSVEEAYALSKAVHPGDGGAFTRYIPLERLPRIYADRRSLARL